MKVSHTMYAAAAPHANAIDRYSVHKTLESIQTMGHLLVCTSTTTWDVSQRDGT